MKSFPRLKIFSPRNIRAYSSNAAAAFNFNKPDKDYPLAKRMRALFERAGYLEELKRSVKSNLIFFRSKNIAEWREAVPNDVRMRLEDFCLGKVLEMINRLQPKLIVTEGVGVFDKLYWELRRKKFDFAAPEVKVPRPFLGGRRYYISATQASGKAGIIGLAHPTGSRIPAQAWQNMATELRRDIGMFVCG